MVSADDCDLMAGRRLPIPGDEWVARVPRLDSGLRRRMKAREEFSAVGAFLATNYVSWYETMESLAGVTWCATPRSEAIRAPIASAESL